MSFFLLPVKEIGGAAAVYKITRPALMTSDLAVITWIHSTNSKIRVCSANVGATALKRQNVGYVMEESWQSQQGRTVSSHFTFFKTSCH